MDDLIETYRAARAASGLRPSAARLVELRTELENGLLVADDDARGFALGTVVGTACRLDVVVVHPEARGQGLGRALVAALAEAAAEEGARSVTVRTPEPGFFAHLGWTPTGETTPRAGEPDGVELTAPLALTERTLRLHDDDIRLGQALKLAGFVDSGVEAKELLATGSVRVNGEVETRRGRRLFGGDTVATAEETVRLVGRS